MNFPCPDSVRCPGTDYPVTNFSSEDPDPPIGIGYSTGRPPTTGFNHYGGGGPLPGPPTGPGPRDPPGPIVPPDQSGTGPGDVPLLDSVWDNPTVTTFAEVTDPAQNPDDVAGNNNVNQLASSDGTPGNGGYRLPNGHAPTVYVNHPQTCTIQCSDGLPFAFTVPVGKFRAYDQAAADRAAYAYACKQAAANRVCLGNINGHACVGIVFDQTIVADTANVPLSWSVTGGAIPAWITATTGPSSLHLTGTPQNTDIGSSVFTIEALDLLGFFITKTFSITVAACGEPCLVTETTLPAFDQGQPYSAQLHATGGTAPYSWSLVEGILPLGLVLSPSGLISGTVMLNDPTLHRNLDQIFTVEVADSGSPVATCEGTITLPVLDYNNFPPGKHWRLQGYVDGTLVGCCSAAVGTPWTGNFDTKISASPLLFVPPFGEAIIKNGGIQGQCKSFLSLGPPGFTGPEWSIQIVCAVDVGAAVWTGKKIGSNGGSKLDSPAGVYTLTSDGFHANCNANATLTIEEY